MLISTSSTLAYSYRTINLSSQASFQFWTQTFIVYFWMLLDISKSSWTFQNVMLKNQLFWWYFFFANVTEFWDIGFLSNSEMRSSKTCEIKENIFWGLPQISLETFAHQNLLLISFIYVILLLSEFPAS